MAVSAGKPWLLGFIPERPSKPHHHISGDPLWGQRMNMIWQFLHKKKSLLKGHKACGMLKLNNIRNDQRINWSRNSTIHGSHVINMNTKKITVFWDVTP
jgi:hypothetical protein